MNFYLPPEKEPTLEEKLLAAVIGVNHRIPVGAQIALPMQLDTSMQAVEELFTAHDLPWREEILTQLKAWRAHAEEGLQFSQECDRLMRRVVRTVGDTIPK
jgi:hypothetical protein